MAADFPFVIRTDRQEIEEKDTATKIFKAMSCFDTNTCLSAEKCAPVGDIGLTPLEIFGTGWHSN